MIKENLKQLIQEQVQEDGLFETGLNGIKLFRATQSIPCAPAVYEPSVIAIVSGSKEALLDSERHIYDASRYLCCPMSMPVNAGTPASSPQNPLLGVYISLNPRVMGELAMEMDNITGHAPTISQTPPTQGIRFARWDEDFSEALFRLVQLAQSQMDMAVLGEARIRELYYAILKGDAGLFAKQAFGAGNAIARAIKHVSSNLETPISIDDMAKHAGMSRAVFHRKFKKATSMSPIQFVKSMRLNNAAMNIAGGMNVNEAALDVGYVSSSQFSREFKRMYGQSPKQWGEAQHQLMSMS